MTLSFRNICLAAATVLIGLMTSACEKEEGEGGRSSISGRVLEQDMFNLVSDSVKYEYPVGDERVYIIYGDESEVFDDDMRTDFNGRYRFRYLRKGTYTIFTYTECSPIIDSLCAASGGVYPIIQTVELGKNEDLVIDDIVIQNY